MFHVYSKENCPYCNAAKKLLALEGQEYKETIIEKDITKDQFFNLYPSVKSVPFIVHFDDETDGITSVGGYQELVKFLAQSKG